MSEIAIYGFGHVGKGMLDIFPHARVIDPVLGYHGRPPLGGQNACINTTAAGCDLAIVCVPTPMNRDDGSCDTSIVESVVKDCDAEYILIKSTIPPGTSRDLCIRHGKKIVFSPEYMGESKYWTPDWAPHPRDPISHGFCILGGHRYWCSDVADMLLPRLGPATRFRLVTWEEAELIKYFENSFFALKVTFSNLMRAVCDVMPSDRVCYHNVREGWLDDPRVGPMHTAAFKQKRGFDGKCLPKDTAALKAFCESIGALPMAEFLDAVIQSNEIMSRTITREFERENQRDNTEHAFRQDSTVLMKAQP